ncbi:minor tail protein [Mycobacterium phage MalagasyRose]|uniref:Minor tail protein n=1 Tax=Mycobacterium phage MalagasyRose TaxID=2599870 RepID=A0A5J6TD81_9CAUD|nr:minor tail protein [Mycobacterium phage MalagasyRose]QFG08873.1 minor tail protein [Mycobacterium phage MalagasyRose]
MTQSPGRFNRGNEALRYQRWETLPPRLRTGAYTRWVYIGPDGSWWDLAGPLAGKQGVTLATELVGAMHMPYEHLLTETAYQMGATYERSNILKRTIKFGAMLGGKGGAAMGLNSHQFDMVHSKWWAAWPIGVPGWLGCHTWMGGWRWIPVMEAGPSETSEKRDPKYAKNNCMTWDMQAVAVRPWYSKRIVMETFTAQEANFTAGHMYDERTIAIANRGPMPQWLKFQATTPPGTKARVWLQDGMLSDQPLKAVPSSTGWFTAEESTVLIDTDEGARTLVASNDPVDNDLYKLMRASKIVEFIFQDLLGDPLGEPLWQRASGLRFTSMIPPRTVANIKVRHSEPGGTVTVMCPQWYTRPY